MVDFKKLAEAASKVADMTKAKQGGGDYTPPAEGNCRLRLVGYVELGKHTKKYKGQHKVENQVELIFEVSGPKHPPAEVDGKKVPIRLSETFNLSLNEKATFFKLFQRLNYAGDATHMVELLGRPFLGTIFHDKWIGQDGKERVSPQLRGPDGYSIRPPRVEDADTGEWKTIEVAPALTPIKVFVWDLADAEQWDTLFIDGEYPARTNDKGEVTQPAKSKNVLQNKIRSALNFPGSPIEAVLLERGIGKLDLPDTDDPEEGPGDEPAKPAAGAGAGADPLSGIGA